MRHSSRFLLAFFIALGVVMLGACASTDAPQPVSQQTPVGAPSVALAQEARPEGVIARVNGVDIPQAHFEQAFAQRQIGSSASDMDALAHQVLEGLIEQEVIRQYAQANGISISDAEAQAELDALKEAVGGAEAWQAFLTMNGYSEADLLAAQYEALLNQRLRDALFRQFEGNILQVHARHIVVENEGVALDIMNRLQSGNDFGQLAQQFSLDIASKDNGGDLGWFAPDELIDERLSQILFSIQDGAIAGPIASRIGYHVVQRLESAVRPIEPERLTLLMEQTYDKWLKQQYAVARIERFR
jgi:parvulin-like peptidyl-prolyl isomerase